MNDRTLAWALLATALAGCSYLNPDYDPDRETASGTDDASTTTTQDPGSTDQPTTDPTAGSGPTDGTTTIDTSNTSSPTDPTAATTVDPTDPTDPTSTTIDASSTDDPTDPDTDSESDTMGMEICGMPNLPNEPVLEVYDLVKQQPSIEGCGSKVLMVTTVNWEGDALEVRNCLGNPCDGLQCDPNPYFEVRVNPYSELDQLQFSEMNLSTDTCFAVQITYDDSIGYDNLCRPSSLALFDTQDDARYMVIDGQTFLPPMIENLNFEVLDGPPQCMCMEECCDMLDPPPGEWAFQFSGMGIPGFVELLEGEVLDPEDGITYAMRPATLKNVRSVVLPSCDRPISWVLSTLPIE